MITAREESLPQIALVNLDGETLGIVRRLCGEFNLKIAVVFSSNGDRLRQESFEGVIMRTDDPHAAQLVAATRASGNQNVILYGLKPRSLDRAEVRGFDVLVQHPVQPIEIAEMLRQTKDRLLPKVRRSLRIPLEMRVSLWVGEQEFRAFSDNLSADGMSLKVFQQPPPDEPMVLSFELPDGRQVTLTAEPRWVREREKEHANSVGVSFGPHDERRATVEEWVSDYLQSRGADALVN